MCSMLPELESQLAFQSPVVQSKAFHSLVEIIEKSKNEVDRRSAIATLWRCGIGNSSSAVVSWSTTTIGRFIVDGRLTEDAVLNEALLILPAAIQPATVIRLLLTLPGGNLIKVVFRVLKRAPKLESTIIDELLHLDDARRYRIQQHVIERADDRLGTAIGQSLPNLPIELVARLPPCLWRSECLIFNSRTTGHLPEMTLDESLSLAICIVLRDSPLSTMQELLMNCLTSTAINPILLAPLSTVHYSIVSDLVRARLPCETAVDAISRFIKASSKPSRDSCDVMPEPFRCGTTRLTSLYLFAKWVSRDQSRIREWISTWCQYKSNRPVTFSNVIVVAFLLFFADEKASSDCLELMRHFAETDKTLANEILLIVLHYYKITQKSIFLQALPGIATNRYCVGIVLKLLLAMASQAKTAVEGLVAIGALYQNHSNIFDQIEQLTKIAVNDDSAVRESKMALIETVCRQGDHAEDLLPTLSAILNSSDLSALPGAVRAITELCRHDLVDVIAVRQMLAKRVATSNNVDALVAYCTLLIEASKLQPEEQNDAFVAECVRELWKMTGHASELVAGAAWRSLAHFPRANFTVGLIADSGDEQRGGDAQSPIAPVELLQIRSTIKSDGVRSGFDDFLHKLIDDEVANLGRSLYTRGGPDRISKRIEGLRSMCQRMRPHLQNEGTSAVAGLCLFQPTIASIAGVAQRAQQALSNFGRLLVHQRYAINDRFETAILYWSGWQSTVTAVYDSLKSAAIESNRGNAERSTRDQMVDAMKQAMAQSEVAETNVVVAIAFLARIVHEDSRSPEAISQAKPWLISVFEFLLLRALLDHKNRSPPVFSAALGNRRCPDRIARLSCALFYDCIDSIEIRSYFSCVDLSSLVRIELDGDNWEGQLSRYLIYSDDDSHDDKLPSVCRAIVDNRRCSSVDELAIPDDHVLYALSRVINAEPLFVTNFVESRRERRDRALQPDFESQLRLVGEDNLQNVLASFVQLPVSMKEKQHSRLLKWLEKNVSDWNRPPSEVIEFAIADSFDPIPDSRPHDYHALPDHSILRILVETQLRSPGSLPLRCLIGHARGDCPSHSLPSLQWSRVLQSSLDSPDSYPILLQLAVEQGDPELLSKITTFDRLRSWPDVVTMAEFLPRIAILDCMPQALTVLLAKWIFATAIESSRWDLLRPLVDALRSAETGSRLRSAVLRLWSQAIPAITEAATIRHALFELFSEIDDLPEAMSPMLHFWHESRRTLAIVPDRLYRALLGVEQHCRPTALLILTEYSLRMSPDDRCKVLLELVACSRIHGTADPDDRAFFLPLVIAVCSAANCSLPPPLLRSSSDNDTISWTTIVDLFPFVFQSLLGPDDQLRQHLVEMGNFLIESLLLYLNKATHTWSHRENYLAVLKVALRFAIGECRDLVRAMDSHHDLWSLVYCESPP